ncbi:MAG: hypothetical protein GY856_42340 [bacterium]|nr:hypothetical protein [bacterium]
MSHRPHQLPEPETPLPKGLMLFAPGTSPGKKRRRLLFVAVYLVVAGALIWPIYPQFSGIFPLILGLPFSLAWMVMALVIGFCAVLWLFLSEEDDSGAEEDDSGTEGDGSS